MSDDRPGPGTSTPAAAPHDAAVPTTTALAAPAPPGRPRGPRVKLAAAAAGLLVLGGLGAPAARGTTPVSGASGTGPAA